jgi:hypothetical protein
MARRNGRNLRADIFKVHCGPTWPGMAGNINARERLLKPLSERYRLMGTMASNSKNHGCANVIPVNNPYYLNSACKNTN